jgi:hypothetical protein
MYTDCNGLLTQSASPFPNSALFQLASAGWVLDKLVIGKPAALCVSHQLYASLGLGSLNTNAVETRTTATSPPTTLRRASGRPRPGAGTVASCPGRYDILIWLVNLQALTILSAVPRCERGMDPVRALAVVAGLRAIGFLSFIRIDTPAYPHRLDCIACHIFITCIVAIFIRHCSVAKGRQTCLV